MPTIPPRGSTARTALSGEADAADPSARERERHRAASLCAVSASAEARTPTPRARVPLTAAPATELRGIHAPFFTEVFFPPQPWTANYFGALSGSGNTQLHVTPVQHRSESPKMTRRKFSGMNFRLFYNGNRSSFCANRETPAPCPPGQIAVTPALSTPPTITGVDTSYAGGRPDLQRTRPRRVGNRDSGSLGDLHQPTRRKRGRKLAVDRPRTGCGRPDALDERRRPPGHRRPGFDRLHGSGRERRRPRHGGRQPRGVLPARIDPGAARARRDPADRDDPGVHHRAAGAAGFGQVRRELLRDRGSQLERRRMLRSAPTSSSASAWVAPDCLPAPMRAASRP